MSPKWARVALAGICAAAIVCYAWGIGRMQLHLYYGPGVHTMSRDWPAWLAGAYDPNLATTFDKLPGPFWPQALSARVFGYSSWAVLLPSLLASVGAILLLYRIVDRWAGPWAGVAAAGFYTVTPLVAALARTQIPDPLLVVLLLAAIAAWQVAVADGRWGPLLWSGVWVGLAFQAKMAQAWLAFVPLGLAYILSGRLPRLLPGEEMDRIVGHVKANLAGERYELAVQWAPQAGQFMLHGIVALPVGGFTAQVPNVTPEQLQRWTAGRELRFALLDGPETKGKPTPDYPGYSAWVRQNCRPVNGFDRPTYVLYDCRL